MKSVYMANSDGPRSAIDDIAFIDVDDEDDSLSQRSCHVQKDETERVGVFDYFSKPVVESSMLIGNSSSCSGIDNYYLGPRSTLPLANAGAKQFKQASQHLNSKAFSAKEGDIHSASYQGNEWIPTTNESNWHFSSDKDVSQSSYSNKTFKHYNSGIQLSHRAMNDEVIANFDSSESDLSQERQQLKLTEQYMKNENSARCTSSQFDQPTAHFDTRVNFSLSNSHSFRSSSKLSNFTEGNIDGEMGAKSSRSHSMLATSRNSNMSAKGIDVTIENGNKDCSESVTSESRTIDMMLGNSLSVIGTSGLIVPQYRLLNDDRPVHDDESDVDYESKSVVQKLERMQRRRQARLEKQAVGLCKADNVPGFRGDESIDELVSYIDASQLPAKQKASSNKQNKKNKVTNRNEKALDGTSNVHKKSAGVKHTKVVSCISSKPEISSFEENDSHIDATVLDIGVSETGPLSNVTVGVELLACKTKAEIESLSTDALPSDSKFSLETGSKADSCANNLCTSNVSHECDNSFQSTVDIHEATRVFENQSGISLNSNPQLTSSSVNELVPSLKNSLKTSEDCFTSVYDSANDIVDTFVTVHRKKRVKNSSDWNTDKSVECSGTSINCTHTSSSDQLRRPSKSYPLAGFHQRTINDKRALSTQSANAAPLTGSFTKTWSNRSLGSTSRSHIVGSNSNNFIAKSHFNTVCVDDSSATNAVWKSDKSHTNHNTEMVIENTSDDKVQPSSTVLDDVSTRTAMISSATSQQLTASQTLSSDVEGVVVYSEQSADQSDTTIILDGQSGDSGHASLPERLETFGPNKEVHTQVGINIETCQSLKLINKDPTHSKSTNATHESKSRTHRANQSVVFLDTQNLQDLTPVRSDISFGFDPQVPSPPPIAADASRISPVVTPVLHYVSGSPNVVYCVAPYTMLPPVAFLPHGRCTPIGVVPPMPSEVGQADLADGCIKANTVTPSSSCSSVFDLFSAQRFMHSEFQRTLESDFIVCYCDGAVRQNYPES